MHENIKKKKGHWESFGDIDGLVHSCHRLLEDTKGNIWIGSLGDGLCCYDGERFVNFYIKDVLASNYINCIHQDREGNIWFGTGGGGLSRYDGKDLLNLNFSIKDGLVDDRVNSIYQDKAGNIWIGTENGLSCYDKKSQSFVNFSIRDGLAANNINGILQDKAGNIWVGTGRYGEGGNGISRYDAKSQKFVNFSTKDGLAGSNINCIYQDKAGNIWIGTTEGLSRYDKKSQRFINFTQKEGLAGSNVYSIYQDKKGSLWFGTYGFGVSCYDSHKHEFVNFNTEDGLANNYVLDIIQDREGNLWFACHGGGISRYNPYEISSISDESVHDVMIQDSSGNLWWGFGNIVSHFDRREEKINHYPFEHPIYDLFEDSKGRLWIGTNGGGVFVYDSIKSFTRIGQGKPCPYITQNLTVDDGLSGNWIFRIYEDKEGNIWIGTENGVGCYDSKKFIKITPDDGLGFEFISAIYQDKSGTLWVGGPGWGNGISSCRFDVSTRLNTSKTQLKDKSGKIFHRYTKNDGLVDDRVVCMIGDNKNNLWIGTFAGISCYDGKSFKNYTTENGLLGKVAQMMMQDSQGHIWIATLGGGVSRFDGKNFQALTTADGLPSNYVTGIIEDLDKAQSKDSDGSFIISTYRGIIRYTPDYKTPPLIRINEVDADRIYKEPEDIQVSENVSSIRIRYHGISFKTKRMRYNYILEGYDQEWKATWGEEVRYENLPAGEYRRI